MKTLHVRLRLIIYSSFAIGVSFGQARVNSIHDTSRQIQFLSGQTAYIVTTPKTKLELRIISRLSDYLSMVLKKAPKIVSNINTVPEGSAAIILNDAFSKTYSSTTSSNNSPEAFTLDTRIVHSHAVVVASGNTELGLKRAVQKLILKSEQRGGGLIIPELHIAESPWIPQREWALCAWDPSFVRGSFSNPNVDKRLNVWLYSDKQIDNYVEMFDWFGFSGGQLLEGCNSFYDRGSPEAFQSVLKKYARAIRENGQDVTYWIWAAQFNNYGWVDTDVVYTPQKGMTAFQDPKVRDCFEKYYNHYAQMAPYVDRLVAHFYDPGQLRDRNDVFNYLGLLRDKFKAKNSKIKLGLDFWGVKSGGDATAEYMKQVVDHGYGDVLMLETSMPSYWPPLKRESLHEEAKRRKLNLGIWGWYTTEYETDQRPSMHVNAHLLSNFYREIKNGVDKIHPITYWSEMEAYHLNNIFTMYASSQLLWNPDRDPDEILREISEGIWGPDNGPEILQALKVIEDVRTGPSWDTYWHTMPNARIGTEDPHEDLRRTEESIGLLEKMKTDTTYVPKFPLPFPPATFVELILPHLRQIRWFADFRIKANKIEEAAKKGTSKEELIRLLNIAWQPVPEYNTWIGVWGQPEAIKQEEMVMKLARDLVIEVSTPGWFRFMESTRLLETIQSTQRNSKIPWKFKSDGSALRSANGFMMWSKEKMKDKLELLLANGCIMIADENTYQLTNWEEYKLP